VTRDITDRKRAEEALQESEKKYSLLINNANESIIVGQDGLLKFVNPMTLDLLKGYLEQELIGRPFPEFIHPDDRSMVVENYRRRIANEAAPSRYAFRVVTRDGIVKWVEINAALIEWQGKPATLNFLTDITSRKQVEVALQESEERFRTLFESSRDALMILAPPSWKFTSGNKATVEMFGAKDKAELISLGPCDVSPERQPDGQLSVDKAREMIETAIREGSHVFEWTHKKLTGKAFP